MSIQTERIELSNYVFDSFDPICTCGSNACRRDHEHSTNILSAKRQKLHDYLLNILGGEAHKNINRDGDPGTSGGTEDFIQKAPFSLGCSQPAERLAGTRNSQQETLVRETHSRGKPAQGKEGRPNHRVQARPKSRGWLHQIGVDLLLGGGIFSSKFRSLLISSATSPKHLGSPEKGCMGSSPTPI